MGYIPPSLDELPMPSPAEFAADPEYYWKKLRDYEAVPYWRRHYGLEDLSSFGRFFRKLFRREKCQKD